MGKKMGMEKPIYSAVLPYFNASYCINSLYVLTDIIVSCWGELIFKTSKSSVLNIKKSRTLCVIRIHINLKIHEHSTISSKTICSVVNHFPSFRRSSLDRSLPLSHICLIYCFSELFFLLTLSRNPLSLTLFGFAQSALEIFLLYFLSFIFLTFVRAFLLFRFCSFI